MIGRDLAAHAARRSAGDTIDAFAYGATAAAARRRASCRSSASRASGRATRPRRTTSSSRPGTIAGTRRARHASPSRRAAAVDRARLEHGRRRGRRQAHRRGRHRCSRAPRAASPRASNDRKQAVLDRAERSGQSLSRLYTSLGAFAVLAGILLLVNIFFMLADERKSELGMLRAVGLRRALARRRVRGRGLVLRGRVGDRRDVRRARARPRADGRGREAVLAARRRLRHRAALRVQVGERAARARRRLRHRDRHRRGHERLAEPVQHHPGDPRHHRAGAAQAAPAVELRRHRVAASSGCCSPRVGVAERRRSSR